jgi:hypothetical protein
MDSPDAIEKMHFRKGRAKLQKNLKGFCKMRHLKNLILALWFLRCTQYVRL